MGSLVDDLITNAEKLGQLSATAIWAFFTILLISYIAWDMKMKKSSSESAWNARIKEAEADSLIANAIEKLAEQFKELRYKIKCREDDDA